MKIFVLLTFFALLGMSGFAQQFEVPVYSAGSKRPSQSGADIYKCLDGDVNTAYHSSWTLNAMPDTVDFYFLNAKSINAIKYTPRTTGTNGVWQSIEVYHTTIDDPANFVKDYTLTWALNNAVKNINYTGSGIVKPFIIRFVIKAAGGNFSSCAEMNFYASEEGTLPTTSACVLPTTGLQAIQDTKLTISSASSTENNSTSENIAKTYDNNLATIYHSKYTNSTFPVNPINLTYNFSGNNQIDYLIYTPRQDGSPNGNFGTGEIWYKIGTGSLIKMMDFDAEMKSSPTRITFTTPLVNTNQIVVKVKSGGNNFVSCAEMAFYTKSNAYLNIANDVFVDNMYAELKPGVTQVQIDAVSSDFFRGLATCIYNNTYDKKFRIQDYQVYPVVASTAAALKTSTYNQFENPTGIAFKANTKAVIIVGPTAGVYPSLKVKNFALDDNATLNSYVLTEGINVIDILKDGLGYIDYYSNNSSLPTIRINIATGDVNGYFDSTRDTANDWVKYLTNGVYPKLDIVGKYVNFNYDKKSLLGNSADGGQALVAAYDEIVESQYTLMGLKKYNLIPKNKMFVYSAYNGGLYAGGQGAHFDLTWGEANYTNAYGVNQDPWGIAHELGHVNQVRPGMRWVGMAEVTNNFYSLWSQYNNGRIYHKKATRLEKEADVVRMGESSIVGGKINAHLFNSYVNKLHVQNNVNLINLVPYWQLMLYYQFAGASKGLPTLKERLAGAPAPINNQVDVAHWLPDVFQKVRNTNEMSLSNGELLLNFVVNTCDAVKEDLTDFFVKAGFLIPVDRLIDDYGTQTLKVTQQQIDNTIAAIKAKNYPKPISPVINYISANSLDSYKNMLPVTGQAMVGVTLITGTVPTLRVDASKWLNVAAFETYNQTTLVDVAIYGTGDASADNTTTTVRYADGASSVYAVGFDGTRKLVYPTVDPANVLVLPVHLTGFKVERAPKGALLKWFTSSENNNKLFEILKSTDGIKFSKIGEKEGNGTKLTASDYQYLDRSFQKSAYYKLVQIDFDGKRTAFDDQVIFIKGLDNEEEWSIYPNPTNSKIFIHLGNTDPVLVKLIDITGKVIQNVHTEVNRPLEMDLSGIAKGVYTLQVLDRKSIRTRKVVKN
jgi:Peptidase M60, enhancin and enhancin-like/Secretion system C-terminal sorting domain